MKIDENSFQNNLVIQGINILYKWTRYQISSLIFLSIPKEGFPIAQSGQLSHILF